MGTDADRTKPGATEGPVTVLVHRTLVGRWEVATGPRECIVCETLDDARRVAYLAVADAHPCELIVKDAYNRVIEDELIDGHQALATGLN
jgi:hypothetical protein